MLGRGSMLQRRVSLWGSVLRRLMVMLCVSPVSNEAVKK